MIRSISASIISPRLAAPVFQATADYNFNQVVVWGDRDFGILITDVLLLDDLSTPTTPPTDLSIDSVLSVTVTTTSGTDVLTVVNGLHIETFNVPANVGSGGVRMLLTHNLLEQRLTDGVGDVITVTVQYTVDGIPAPNDIKLYHRTGITPGFTYGEIVGCGAYTDILTGNLVDANLSCRLRSLRSAGVADYGASLALNPLTRIQYMSIPGTPPQANSSLLSLSDTDTLVTGPVQDSSTFDIVTDPSTPFAAAGPSVNYGFAQLMAGDEFIIYASDANALQSGFVTPADGPWNPNTEYLSCTYFSVSQICEVSAYLDLEQGCTDPIACNYDADADIDNGTCTYDHYCVALANNFSDTSNSSVWATTPSPMLLSGGFTVAWGDQNSSYCGFAYGEPQNPFNGGGSTLGQVDLLVNGVVVDTIPAGSTQDYNTATGGYANLAFTNVGPFNAGETYSFQILVQMGAGSSGCSVASSVVSIVMPEVILPGCTDSTAYNYSAAATFDNGSCSYCNSYADYTPNMSVTTTQPASTSAASDGITTLQMGALGPAFNSPLTANQVVLFPPGTTLAQAINYMDGAPTVTPLATEVFSGTNAVPPSVSFAFDGLPGNTSYRILVYNPTLYNAGFTNCYHTTTFDQPYYACTDIDNPLITNAVVPSALVLTNNDLCTYTTDCPGQALSVTLTPPSGVSCIGQIDLNITGAVVGMTNVVVTEPSGSSYIAPIPFETGILTLSNSAPMVGTYTFDMTTVSPDALLNCTETATLVITEDDLEFCGCTDPNASNYNPNADNDDGSCYYIGCTDPSALNYSSSASGCGESLPSSDNSCCIYFVYGCTDPNADNYDPTATADDGSCEYTLVEGCTDPQAVNYNPSANFGSPATLCDYVGCTDASADNPTYYTTPDGTSVLANISNGSCFYSGDTVSGCTDPAADNYNEDAEVDDGSCTYDGVEGNGGGGGGGTTLTVPNYNVFVEHVQNCVSKTITGYHKKIAAGMSCDRSRVLHLALINRMLRNKQIKCLFDGSDTSTQKLNNFIKFALMYCDDCEYDLAPAQESLESNVIINISTLGGIQDSDGGFLIDNANEFVNPADADNLTI